MKALLATSYLIPTTFYLLPEPTSKRPESPSIKALRGIAWQEIDRGIRVLMGDLGGYRVRPWDYVWVDVSLTTFLAEAYGPTWTGAIRHREGSGSQNLQVLEAGSIPPMIQVNGIAGRAKEKLNEY